MIEQPRSRSTVDPMLISAYVVTAAVSMLGVAIFVGGEHPHRWLGLALLALFDVMVLLPERFVRPILRRSPHLYTGVATALVTALVLLPPVTPWFVILFFVISPTVMMVFPRQTGYAWVGVFSALTVVMFMLVEPRDLGNLLQAALYIAGYFFFAAFATQTALANEAQAESQRLLADLQDAHSKLRAYAAQAEELAVAEERNRMAREMHDTVGHRLTVTAVQLQAIERLMRADPDRAAAMAVTVRDEVREALAELRATVAALRAPLEEDLALEPALRKMVSVFQAGTGLPVRLSLPDASPAMPPSHRLALYRGAQEALTNIQKHARASQAWLALTQEDGAVVLRVSDDGRGPDVMDIPSGFGLLGMQERAQHLGGTARLGVRPGGGSELVLILPLEVDHA